MPYDLVIFHALNGLAGQSAFGDTLVVFFATYLAFITVAAYGLYLAFMRSEMSIKTRWIRFLVPLCAGLIARVGIVSPIRFFFPRERPFLVSELHTNALFMINESSFPSGHSAFFFAFATVIFCYDRWLGVIFYALAIAICAGRVAAGVHYPSDILGGAVVGILTGYLIYRFAVPFLKRVMR